MLTSYYLGKPASIRTRVEVRTMCRAVRAHPHGGTSLHGRRLAVLAGLHYALLPSLRGRQFCKELPAQGSSMSSNSRVRK